MKLTEKELINLVVEGGFVARKQFDEVAQYAKAEGKDIEEALIERDLITDSHLGRLVAEKRGYQFVEVSKKSIPEEACGKITADYCVFPRQDRNSCGDE